MLPAYKKIRKENIPEAPKWVDFIINPFNEFVEKVYSLFNKGITFDDNINSDKITLPGFTTNDLPYTFQNRIKGIPAGLQVIKAQIEAGSFIQIGAPVFPEWEYNSANNSIILHNLTNLSSDKKYSIILRVT